MEKRYLLLALKVVWQKGKPWLFYTGFFTIISGVQPLFILWLTMELINEITRLISSADGKYGTAMVLLLLQFLLVVFYSFATKVNSYINKKFEITLDHHLQKQILAKSSGLSYHFMEDPEIHNHLQRIMGSSSSSFLAPIRNAMGIGRSVLHSLSYMGFLFSFHWSLVVVALLPTLSLFRLQVKLGAESFHVHYRLAPTARETSYISGLLTDKQSGKEIRLFGLNDVLLNRWSTQFLKNSKASLALLKKRSILEACIEALSALFYIFSAMIMIWLAVSSKLQIGDFVSLSQAVQGVQVAIQQVSQEVSNFFEKRLFLRDFYRFIELEEERDKTKVSAQEQSMQLIPHQGIVFANVSFSYPKSHKKALENVSFHILPHEKVAIVGENGSGKTTIVKCLLGLYKPDQGQIYYNGNDISEIDQEVLKKDFTVIFQDFMRYQFTLKDNIVFGDISEVENWTRMEQAAKESGVALFAEKLPDGYNTFLGKMLYDGEDLSGGQWQKIALARGLFRKGEVIVLDEPTAALDPKTELEVFQNFESLTKGKTAIYISHRMAAAKMADRIIVVKEGEIVEVGTHQELMALGKEYFSMYQSQARWFSEESKEVVAWKS
ncbi:ABC transporter ATP-binding protein [Brevibacillus reuszeri]|uniref:ABC transporter ATP-binding protein n=1 Tax=Brevibacillus reuszeri TaxID=54915 RepID=UPI0013DE862F|nr:ABC transporter ATP-binding protein [Brevibacillus reuszeri]